MRNSQRPRNEAAKAKTDLLTQADLQLAVRQAVQHVQVTQTQVTRSGPVPEASEMAAFKNVQADLPERIMRMAERALEAEITSHTIAENRQYEERSRARIYGLIYALAALGATVWLALAGHPWVAGVVGGTTAVAVVATLVRGHDPLR